MGLDSVMTYSSWTCQCPLIGSIATTMPACSTSVDPSTRRGGCWWNQMPIPWPLIGGPGFHPADVKSARICS